MGALTGPSRCPGVAPRLRGLRPWAGESPAWQLALERGLTRAHPGEVTLELRRDWVDLHERGPGVLIYRHVGLAVPGRTEPMPVRVEFYEQPPYDCYGLQWHDHPRVFADPGAASKHRMPDDALCLYYPGDPAHQRWTAENGLGQLFAIVSDHLFYEQWWRHTGGHNGGEWLGDEAEHGFPEDRQPSRTRTARRRRRAA